jgi:cold-inducible RNA-binding protein
MTNLFVGNLDITVTEQQLRELFAAHGAVETITIVKDRDTGEPRGIAFVEMTQAKEAQGAISALNGTMLNGRPMNVNEARPNFIEIRCTIRTEEIIGDTRCELRTRQLFLDRFSARNEMGSL